MSPSPTQSIQLSVRIELSLAQDTLRNGLSETKRMTPTDRLSGFGTGLAANSDSSERVPWGHALRYSYPDGSARACFFSSLATQPPRDQGRGFLNRRAVPARRRSPAMRVVVA